MTNYEPDSRLTVDGDASAVDRRCSDAGVSVTGSVASVDGEVGHIVVDDDLSESELSALESEFGVSWSKVVTTEAE